MKRLFNGHVIETATGSFDLPADAAGIFETVLLRDGVQVFSAEHWARFQLGCQWGGVPCPWTRDELDRHADALLRSNGVPNGLLRYAAWKRTNRVDWCIDALPKRPHMIKSSMRLTWGPRLPPPGPDRAHKHLSRTLWWNATVEARQKGFDDALLQDELGRIIEGGVSNIFFVRDDTLFTPDLGLGPLPGVARAAVLAAAKKRDWRTVEGAFTSTDLLQAQEVWVTNSLIGIRPVELIDEHVMSEAHPVLAQYRTAFLEDYGWDPGAASNP